jgi:hypothetical protein
MMKLLFCEKTPSFPRKYQTSPIPNIIDQLVFITRNIYHHENNCCSLSSKNLFSKFKKLSHLGLVETSFMLTFDLWPWHIHTHIATNFFFHMTLPTVEGIIFFLFREASLLLSLTTSNKITRENLFEMYVYELRWSI